MLSVTIKENNGAPVTKSFDKSEVTIGRVKGNDIVLPKGNVSKRHARIVVKDTKVIIVDLKSTNGTYIGSQKITGPHVLKEDEVIRIGDFILQVKHRASTFASREHVAPSPSRPPFGSPSGPYPAASQSPAPSVMGGSGIPPMKSSHPFGNPPPTNAMSSPFGSPPPAAAPSSGAFGTSPPPFNSAFGAPPPSNSSPFPASMGSAGHAPVSASHSSDRLVPPTMQMPRLDPNQISQPSIPATPSVEEALIGRATMPPRPQLLLSQSPEVEVHIQASQKIFEVFLESFNAQNLPESYPIEEAVKEEVHKGLEEAYEKISDELPSNLPRTFILNALLNEAIGLGPLEEFLDKPEVTAVHIYSPTRILIEEHGQWKLTSKYYTNPDLLYLTAMRLFYIQGIQEDLPLVNEARFSDGTQVQVILPPIAPETPIIVIRKPQSIFSTIDALAEGDMFTGDMADFFQVCLDARQNILIVGPQGAGRSTFLNALIHRIPEGTRLIAVESMNTLQVPQQSGIVLKVTPEATQNLSASKILEHAIRLMPDRLIVDEIRGPEAKAFLLATATGASGSMGTLQALHGRDALQHLEQLALLDDYHHNPEAMAREIAHAIDIIVVIHRLEDGSRRVVEVSEVLGFRNGDYDIREIFLFQRRGRGDVSAQNFRATGYVPKFYRELQNGGLQLNVQIFQG